MDQDDSLFPRVTRTFWAAWAYITTSVVRFLRTEADAESPNSLPGHEDDVAVETVSQKCEEEHPERGTTETEIAVGSPMLTEVRSHVPTVKWQKQEGATGCHDEETNVYSVHYSKTSDAERGLEGEEPEQVSFHKQDDRKQDIAAESGEHEKKHIQHATGSEDRHRETLDITLSPTEHATGSDSKLGTLMEKVDETLRTKAKGLVMSGDSAAGDSRIEGGSELRDSEGVHSVVRGREDSQEEEMMMMMMMEQKLDSGDDAGAPQTIGTHTEEDAVVFNVTLTELSAPLSNASPTHQEVAVTDATLKDQDKPLPIATFTDHEEEIHTLSRGQEEVAVTSSVECVDEVVKTQEVDGENYAEVSVANFTSLDQVDSVHNSLREDQELISPQSVEQPMTVWYYKEVEEDAEASENEECEGGLQEEAERSGGQRTEVPADDKHLCETSEEAGKELADEDNQRDLEELGLEGQVTEDDDQKAGDQDEEEMIEQELVCANDQNRLEVEPLQGQIKEEDDTEETIPAKHMCEEQEENSSEEEEDYGDGEKEESTWRDDAAVMLQDSPLAAEPVIVTDTTLAISEMCEEDLLMVGQYTQEMSANAQETMDGASEVTNIAIDHSVEEQRPRKAEPFSEEAEEEHKDEFEDLRPAEESEDEGVSIKPDDTEVQEAHGGWDSKSNSEEEGDNDFNEDFTSSITEASDALLYHAEIPELESMEAGTEASLLREDADATTTEEEYIEAGTDALLQMEDADTTTTEEVISVASKPEDSELDMLRESQMESLESGIAAGSGHTEHDHTPDILRNNRDGIMADPGFVKETSGMVMPRDAPEDITPENSDSEREHNLSETSESMPESESKHRLQEEAEHKMKRQLSNQSNSSDEGRELEIKGLTTTIFTDEKQRMESESKLYGDVVMGSERVDVSMDNSKLISGNMDSEAKCIEVTEEQIKEPEKDMVEASGTTAPETGMEIDPQPQPDSENTAPMSQEDVEGEDDKLLKQTEGSSALSEKTDPNKGAPQKEGNGTESTLVKGIAGMESESDFHSSETNAVSDGSLRLGQEVIKGEEATSEAPQRQADTNTLWSDQQILTPEADTNTPWSDQQILTPEADTNTLWSDQHILTPEADTNTLWSDQQILTPEADTNTPWSDQQILTPEADTNTLLSDQHILTPEADTNTLWSDQQILTPEADTNTLWSDQQILPPEADTGEPPELSECSMEQKALKESVVEPQAPQSINPESESECDEKILEGTGKTESGGLCETGSISSDEDEQHRENAAKMNLIWEPAENKSEVLEDKVENESESVMEIVTDMTGEIEFETAQEGRARMPVAEQDHMEDDIQEALPEEEDMAELNGKPDVQHMATMKAESEETTKLDGRSVLKRKFENVTTEEEALADEPDHTQPLEELSAGDFRLQVSSLDFSVQKSRIAVKNPLVRPPKDPRTLLNLPSLEPTPRAAEAPPGHPGKKVPMFGVPLGGLGVMGVKLPGLGAGFPVLRKTNQEAKEEKKSEGSPALQTSETEQRRTEDAAEEVQTQSKPKWTPPKHAVGMGNPFMMAELKGKLKKTPKE
ncbi:titin homolog [Clupea harengus]|uniref:Titin homolog n=1 Tax=Clupea harengus TaxID=7950 RepID=A0A6P8FJY0_CLUHA|nr:titin homolog [Clupea harengus]